MLNTNFGIEIEFTGITRKQAAEKAAEYLGGRVEYLGTYYDTYGVKTPDGRTWKFTYDGSIRCEKKNGSRKEHADSEHSVEMVSPILTYANDMETLQELIRQLRHIGGFANETCGIHIHCDGAQHTPQSIKNLLSIVYSKNDLLY
ncbi:MAG TPA: amidoligase family protein, partial [Ruminococcus sp.]|nr:amidoligase family protein [Ruminococcus sp.]